MSLGPFSFFMASADNPLGLCEATPIFRINHALHKRYYGFVEDAIPYDRAGRIMKSREHVKMEHGDFPPALIERGVQAVRTIADSASISGYKHPATILFWPYWQQVFKQVDDLEVIPVFLLRAPSGIASSYARRAKRPEYQEALFDVIEVYLSKMLKLYLSWSGPKPIVRFDEAHYQNDLKNAVETCGLVWDTSIFDQHFQPSATVAVDNAVDHPVQRLYTEWSGFADSRTVHPKLA